MYISLGFILKWIILRDSPSVFHGIGKHGFLRAFILCQTPHRIEQSSSQQNYVLAYFRRRHLYGVSVFHRLFLIFRKLDHFNPSTEYYQDPRSLCKRYQRCVIQWRMALLCSRQETRRVHGSERFRDA